MCEAIEDYKKLDSQHELQTTTLNQTGLDKATLMTTINQNERCSELNRCKMMYPCQLNQVLNSEYPKIPYDHQYHQHPNQSTEDQEEEELHV